MLVFFTLQVLIEVTTFLHELWLPLQMIVQGSVVGSQTYTAIQRFVISKMFLKNLKG